MHIYFLLADFLPSSVVVLIYFQTYLLELVYHNAFEYFSFRTPLTNPG